MQLKQICQRKFEETHSREEFMAIIGRNYLIEEETDAQRQNCGESGFYLIDTSDVIDEGWEEE